MLWSRKSFYKKERLPDKLQSLWVRFLNFLNGLLKALLRPVNFGTHEAMGDKVNQK